MTKLVVVEARRLLPIAVLFLMLLAVSIYDSLTRATVPVTAQPNSVPYKTLVATSLDNGIQVKVVTSLDMWVTMHDALGLPLTDHDYDPQREIAVFLLNCQLRSTRQTDDGVELAVTSSKGTVQLILFDKAHLDFDPQRVRFTVTEKDKGY